MTTLNIVCYNCWGLKYIAKLRRQRIAEIADRLATAYPRPDIVGLQECFTQEDYLTIRQHTSLFLSHGKFYHSGSFGSGLAILSRYPIEESTMHAYTLNGRPTAFFRGDWYVGKGVAIAQIRLDSNPGTVVEIFNTHLHAPYQPEPQDSYLCHRTAQAWEMAKLLHGAVARGHLVVALGDFNFTPDSLAYRILTGHGCVHDAWRVLHPDSSLGAASNTLERARCRPVPTAGFNVRENGATCDSALNTWRWSNQMQKRLYRGEKVVVEDSTPDPRAKRLDYIFVGNSAAARGQGRRWKVDRMKLGMMERHPSLHCSLSDHFSLEATLDCSSSSPSPELNPWPANPTTPLPSSIYITFLALIATYRRRELTQRRWRLTNFCLSVLLSIGCLTAIWWAPNAGVGFALAVVSTVALAQGVVDGLIGGLFMSAEIGKLKELAWEVENRRVGVMGDREGDRDGDGDGDGDGRKEGGVEG